MDPVLVISLALLASLLAAGVVLAVVLAPRDPRRTRDEALTEFDRAMQRARSREDLGRLQ